MEQKLTRLLVEQRLVTAEALAIAEERHRKTGRKLADCLVDGSAVAEADVLRFLAAHLGTRFVTSRKLSQVKVPDEVLRKVPVRFAEENSVVPIAFDPGSDTLTVVAAEPAEDLPPRLSRLSLVARVTVFLALDRVVQAAIRKAYYADPTAFGDDGEPVATRFRCPSCEGWVSSRDFQCPNCELLLNASARSRTSSPREASVVSALISLPESTPHQGIRAPAPSPDDTRMEALPDPRCLPELTAGLDVAVNPIHPQEAFAASFVDGAMSICEIADVAGLSVIETQALFASLERRGVVRLRTGIAFEHPPVPPPPAAEREAGPPAPDRAAPVAIETVVSPWAVDVTPPPTAQRPVAREGTSAPGAAAKVAGPGGASRSSTAAAGESRAAPVGQRPPAAPDVGKRPEGAVDRRPPGSFPSTASPGAGQPGRAEAGAGRPGGDSTRGQALGRIQPVRQTAGVAQDVLQRVIQLEKSGDLAGAVRLLEDSISLLPEPQKLYNRLALILLNQHKDLANAQRLLERAITLEPTNAVFQQNLVKVLLLKARAAAPEDQGGL